MSPLAAFPFWAHDLAAHAAVPHQHCQVDTEPYPFLAFEVLGEARPSQPGILPPGLPQPLGHDCLGVVDRGRGVTAVAADLGGDALQKTGDTERLGEQGTIAVGVDIDEARADGQFYCIDGTPRLCGGEIAHGYDPLTLDADVRREPGVADSVIHPAANDLDVQHVQRCPSA